VITLLRSVVGMLRSHVVDEVCRRREEASGNATLGISLVSPVNARKR
jgi:hypothetical protein